MKLITICLLTIASQSVLKAQDAKEGEAAGEAEAKADLPQTEVLTEFDRLFPPKEFYTAEEVAALRKVLETKSNKLSQDIESEKEYTESLKKQVGEHLAKISEARDEIADFMNERDEKEEGKLKKLARFYEAMDAEQAAPLFRNINDELAIKIFERMDTKKAGGVLALLPPQRAARITANFPRLKVQVGGVEN